MSRIRISVFVALAVALIFTSGFVVASLSGTEEAVAQDAKSGPWKAIMPPAVCTAACDLANVAPNAMQDMSTFADLGAVGDPNGSPALAINVITKLEQDGCEWEWQTGGQQVVILYRC